ncbi:group II intron reverse transcriptase/maturase [Actinoallomurus acanthiterrae]
MNTGEPTDPDPYWAERRVLGMQTKLHRWAGEDRNRRFDDLFNLVTDPDFLLIAWERVRGNTGARTAGIDGRTARDIETDPGVLAFLDDLRDQLRSRTFRPVPVRERMIPKSGGKLRRLGIPTMADRVVQASLKLVLEPIFERDFQPCSYGFRPNRRAHDALAEIHHFGSRKYHWVLEGDIEACFDTIDHAALMDRVRRRIGDKRVLALVKAFCKAGILTELGERQETRTGTPQGGILSPLLANIALSVLDDYFVGVWRASMKDGNARFRRRQKGLANWRLIRYADDWVVMVAGTRNDAEQLRQDIADLLAPMGLRLSEEKTKVVHLGEGFDFLGYHIRWRRKRGTSQRHVYTYPSKKALRSIKTKVRTLTCQKAHPDLKALLLRVNSVVRGWCHYFKYGSSSGTFGYLNHYLWWRVARWLRKRHGRLSWKQIRRKVFTDGYRIVAEGIELFNPAMVATVHQRWRGYNIPTPWSERTASPAA